MSKIISLVVSYNPHNPYVPIVVKELRKRTKVLLFTTSPPNFEVDNFFIYEKSIGADLVYKPREWILDNIDGDWDYVLYNEDDILIKDSVLNTVVGLYEALPSGLIPGFARYESILDSNKRYIDLHPSNSVHRHGFTIIKEVYKDLNIWEPWNLHSGNFLFSKEDMSTIIRKGKFEKTFSEYGLRYGSCGQLESAASVLYYEYTKVLPREVSNVQVHHLPNKYIKLPHNYGDICGPSELDIIKEYDNA